MRIDSALELADAVRVALTAADRLGLYDAALHLNEALIVLTGSGVAPAGAMTTPLP